MVGVFNIVPGCGRMLAEQTCSLRRTGGHNFDKISFGCSRHSLALHCSPASMLWPLQAAARLHRRGSAVVAMLVPFVLVGACWCCAAELNCTDRYECLLNVRPWVVHVTLAPTTARCGSDEPAISPRWTVGRTSVVRARLGTDNPLQAWRSATQRSFAYSPSAKATCHFRWR